MDTWEYKREWIENPWIKGGDVAKPTGYPQYLGSGWVGGLQCSRSSRVMAPAAKTQDDIFDLKLGHYPAPILRFQHNTGR